MKKISVLILFGTLLTTTSFGMDYETYLKRNSSMFSVVKEWKNPLIEEQQANVFGCYHQCLQQYRQDIICSSKTLANYNQEFPLNNSENTIRNILGQSNDAKKIFIEIEASKLPGAFMPIDSRYSFKIKDLNFISEDSSVRKDELELNINVLKELKESNESFLSRIL